MAALFVYGTLVPGGPNAHVLAEVPGTWTAATVTGTLHDEGWGAEQGCPGMVPHPEGTAIHGMVLRSDALPTHWARLDAFEGAGYVRVVVPATLADGTTVAVNVYALRREGAPRRRD